jgi:hypothetical protein
MALARPIGNQELIVGVNESGTTPEQHAGGVATGLVLAIF